MSESLSENEDLQSWIDWFCDLPENIFFCRVDRSYIGITFLFNCVEDTFNLYGLREEIPEFRKAYETILDLESDNGITFLYIYCCIELDSEDSENNGLFRPAVDLYGLIHARFIVTERGLQLMAQKFINREFGVCPRVHCQNQPVLPVGFDNRIGIAGVKVFCPRCKDIYIPNRQILNGRIDGAFFGTTFPHLFLMTYSEYIPREKITTYEQKVFGFKIHPSSDVYRYNRFESLQKKISNGENSNGNEEQQQQQKQQ